MEGDRGNTYQPNGYLRDNKPNEIQMRNYNQPRDRQPESQGRDQRQRSAQIESAKEGVQDQQSTKGYLLHWVCFIIAMAVNVGVWAVDYFAVKRQYSYYYANNITVNPYVDTTIYADSITMFSPDVPTDTLAIAMGLVYGWVLWKAPLALYALNLTSQQQSKGLRIGTWVGELVLLLAGDILMTIYARSFYGEWIFFGMFIILTLIVAIVNNAGLSRVKEAILNTLIPLLLIATLYVVYVLLLPKLYSIYLQKLSYYSALFLAFYLYPAFDILIYSIVLFLGNKVEHSVKNFFSAIHFLMLGYSVSVILMVGYTEVQFYYLIGYFIFRNVFVNYVMRRWLKVVANPPALPGWGIAYYVGYALSFMPVVGLGGKIVVAKSFMSYIYSLTVTALYGTANPLYFSRSPPTVSLTTNFSFDGNIFWLAGAIIWVGMTFSQRYSKHMPSLYDTFYYLLGLQLFFIGLATGLSTMIMAVTPSAHI